MKQKLNPLTGLFDLVSEPLKEKLTGLTKAMGTVAATDTILQALNKTAANVENLEGKNVRTTRFFTISSGTSGTITIPTGNTIILDDFGDGVDALVTPSSGGRPSNSSARTAGGIAIATTFDAAGNYVLSGTPVAYPICLVYRSRISLKDYVETDADIVDSCFVNGENVTVYQTIAAIEAISGYSGEVAYVVGKVGFFEYCVDCNQTVDHDIVLSTSAGGTTRWVKAQTVKRGVGDVGWVDTDAAVLTAFSSTVVRLTVSSTAIYAVRGLRVELPAGNYDCTLSGVAGVKFIYFDDNSKGLKFSGTLFDFAVQCPVSVVYWSGTAIVAAPQTEFHGIRDIAWHKWAHNNLGTQYKEGLLFTGSVQPNNITVPADATVQYLWSTTGKIVDEDVESNPGVGQWLQTLGSGLTSSTAAIFNFFYYNGSFVTTQAAMADRSPFIHGGGVTFPYWNNGGVIEEASDNRYVVYHYFATPMTGGWAVFARPHNAQFTTLALAVAARPSQLTWSNYSELKHIYTAIFRTRAQFVNTPHRCKLVSLQDFRLTAGSPVAGVSATDHQALSNRAAANSHPLTAISGLAAGSIPFVDTTTLQLNEDAGLSWDNTGKVITATNIQCKNAWLLQPRSGTAIFDANNWTTTSFAATKWIDGSVTNLNLPLNAGMIHQFDSLFGVVGAEAKYRVQEFTAVNRWWKRSRNNNVWQPWKELTMV